MTSVIIEIGPDTATDILTSRNKGNRPPKPNKVEQFCADMDKGRWGLTGDTIKFGADGRLLDGQNRLSACVRANTPFKTHVVFGIDPALFGRMDIGKPRNSADILHIAGFKYASTLAVAIRWAHLLDTYPFNRLTLQPDFVLNLAKDKYADIEPLIKTGRDINRQYQIIETMQALLHLKKANNNGRIHELTRASAIIKAWNIFKLGHKESLAQLQAAANARIENIG